MNEYHLNYILYIRNNLKLFKYLRTINKSADERSMIISIEKNH